MKVEGAIEVSLPPEKLWDLLQDPEFLKEVMPGCRELKRTGEDRFEGLVSAKVGAIASEYQTVFSLSDKNPPVGYRLELQGKGKGGFVNASTKVQLQAMASGTRLHYEGDVSIGGTIARIGQRLVDAAAKMLLNQGFKSLQKKIEERAAG